MWYLCNFFYYSYLKEFENSSTSNIYFTKANQVQDAFLWCPFIKQSFVVETIGHLLFCVFDEGQHAFISSHKAISGDICLPWQQSSCEEGDVHEAGDADHLLL